MDHFLDAAFKRAKENGDLDNLPGEGKPISVSSLTADPFAHVYRESGVMHPMDALRAEVSKLRAALAGETDPTRLQRIKKQIAMAQTQLAVEAETWKRYS